MTDSITIYKQIYPAQCVKLNTLGYRSLINIRPDNESEGQPLGLTLARAADDAGLCYRHLPFTSNHLDIALVEQFAVAYHSLPKPIMLFCGSGHRAKLLYQSARLQDLL